MLGARLRELGANEEFSAVRAKDVKDTPSRVCFAILAAATVVAGVIIYPRYLWTPPWTWIDYVIIPLFGLICATITVTAILTLRKGGESGSQAERTAGSDN